MSFRPDYEAPVGAIINYVLSRGDVDPQWLALYGISYGGYFAEKTAAGPLFVFAKGSYIGGIVGLNEEEAIQTGKEFAARIPY